MSLGLSLCTTTTSGRGFLKRLKTVPWASYKAGLGTGHKAEFSWEGEYNHVSHSLQMALPLTSIEHISLFGYRQDSRIEVVMGAGLLVCMLKYTK
jgi:hypothetical protein